MKHKISGIPNNGFNGLTRIHESNAAAFGELAVFMKSDNSRVGVEIHGCGVASDTSIIGPGATIEKPFCLPGSTQNGNNGLIFLKKLAKSINRKVKAGLHCQTVENRYDTWKFEGPTITVTPWGSSWLR